MTSPMNSSDAAARSSGSVASTNPTHNAVPIALGSQVDVSLSLMHFHLIRIIGTGTYANVCLAEVKSSGQVVVLKEMRKALFHTEKSVQWLLNEKTVLEKLRHPFFVESLGFFQNSRSLYIVMEYVPGGELFRLLREHGTFSQSQAQFYAAEIASAVAFLHSSGVVYRDLKGENVLIAANGHIKLVDFGMTRWLKKDERTFSLCGTPHGMAPEVVNRSGHDFACDWWSLGVLLYEMITGELPFDGESAYEMYAKILSQPFRPPKEADQCSVSLLEGLLQKDPKKRISQSQVLNHAFFAGVDWGTLQEVHPPFVPDIKHSLDSTCFDHYEPMSDLEDSLPLDDSLFVNF